MAFERIDGGILHSAEQLGEDEDRRRLLLEEVESRD